MARHGAARRDGPLSTLSTLQGQHLLPGARAKGDAIGKRRGLQRPERVGLVRIGVGGAQVGLSLLFDDRPLAGEQLASIG